MHESQSRQIPASNKLLELLQPDISPNLVADTAPAREIGLEVQLLGRSNAAIKRDPAHDLGIDEMTWTRARFSRFSTLMTPSSSQQVRL